MANPPSAGRSQTHRWQGYEIFLVLLLLLISISSYLDRSVLALMQESIKRDLALTDFQLGLMGGPAFSMFYALAGVPAARLADRMSRGKILAACVTLWSTATALCFAAAGFVQLALCRVGVGAGEGGAIPISQSLLADRFPPSKRGLVMSILASAYPLASMLLPLVGGLVAQPYGWRVTFLVVGMPGLLLAVVAWFTIREPRGNSAQIERRSFWGDMALLARIPSFVLLCIAAVLLGIGMNAIALFEVSFVMRSHGLSVAEAGALKGATGIAGLVAAVVGGWASDHFADARGRSYLLIPALGGFLTTLCYLAAFSVADARLAVAMLVLAAVAYNLKNGPLFAAVQNMVPGEMRATGAAIFMLSTAAIGGAAGPPLLGKLSDWFTRQAFAGSSAEFAQACTARLAAHAELGSACQQASEEGLRLALMIMPSAFLLSSLFLVFAARHARIQDPEPYAVESFKP